MPYFFLRFLAFLLAVNAAYGIRCYTCNSAEDSSCASSVPSKSELCPSSDYHCHKITMRIMDGTEFIGRGCIPESPISCDTAANVMKAIISGNAPDIIKDVHCDTCNTDNCNSAQKITGVTFIGLILAATILMF